MVLNRILNTLVSLKTFVSVSRERCFWMSSLLLACLILNLGLFQGTLQQFVDDFFRSVLCSGAVVPPAVKYFFDFLDEQALKQCVDEETIHIWKTNRSDFNLTLHSYCHSQARLFTDVSIPQCWNEKKHLHFYLIFTKM